MNINIFKDLSHEVKVMLAMAGSALVVLCNSPELITALFTQPLSVSIPLILPKLIAPSTVGGAFFNMMPKKDEGKEQA